MPPEPLVLGFDTSAAHCAAALVQGAQVLSSRRIPLGRGQTEALIPMLEETLSENQLSWSDLTAIGVGTGPGNFTGIRISVAAARGLALALGIPAIGVTTFAALAHPGDNTVLTAVQAGRGHVATQLFRPGQPPAPPAIHPLDQHPPVDDDVRISGDVAAPLADVLGRVVLTPAHPLAEAIALIAAARRDHDGTRPTPLYLRPPNAARSTEPPVHILT